MNWSSDGTVVKQTEIKHLPKSNKCSVCGKKKKGNQPCKSKFNRMSNLMDKYVKKEFELCL